MVLGTSVKSRLIAAAVLGILVTALVTACQPVAPVTVAQSVDNAWSGGYAATLAVANTGTTPITAWKLEFELAHHVTGVWNGNLVSQTGTHVVLTAPSWAPDLGAGASISIGYTAELTGPRQEPTKCMINGRLCRFVAPATTTTTTSTAPGTSTSTRSSTSTSSSSSTSVAMTTTTTVPGPPSTRGPVVAPYVDVTLWPPPDLAAIAAASGIRHVTLAFVINGASACAPAWGGVTPISDPGLRTQVANLRAAGGDVVVSFGGAAGTELAQTCPTSGALADAYQTVIDSYGASDIDFDIEGGAIADGASVTRRSQAVAVLQQRARSAGRPLRVSMTLPVVPTGLTADGTAVVRSVKDAGVALDLVNLMAMDYGDAAAPNPEGHMGAYAIQASTSVVDQLRVVGIGADDGARWALVGVTPMIGQNDATTERFSLADAQQLVDAAALHHLGRLAFWSVARDQSCPGGPSVWASPTCSGIAQPPWAFSAVFNHYTG